MNYNEIMKDLAQYTRLAEDIATVIEGLKDQLKVYMMQNQIDTLSGDEHKATYKQVVSNRIDTESANEKRAELLKNAAEIENDLTHIDEYVQQVEYIKQLFDKMEKSLNWRTRDIFNLNYHIRNY